jgi:hypothetical protein
MVSVVRWLLIKPILSLFTILVYFQNHFPSFIMMDFAKNEPILIALQLFETLKNDVAFPKKKVPTYISFRRLWWGPPSLPLWGDVVYGWSLTWFHSFDFIARKKNCILENVLFLCQCFGATNAQIQTLEI